MDDEAELELKTICCTCLSIDRKLFQLCKIHDGVNNLYFLLSYDPEAYKEGFFKDSTSLYVCWECRALIRRVACFRLQACAAQRHLSSPKIKNLQSLSRLTKNHKSSYDDSITSASVDIVVDNFIDCDAVEVKTEADDDLEDLPLSALQGYHVAADKTGCCSDQENHTEILPIAENQDDLPANIDICSKRVLKSRKKLKKKVIKNKSDRKRTKMKDKGENKEFYKTTIMNDKEMNENIERRKTEVAFVNSSYKCEFCLEIFENQAELEEHHSTKHVEKVDHKLCDICRSYVPEISYAEHREHHFLQFACKYCEHITCQLEDMVKHFNNEHDLSKLGVTVKRKKGRAGAAAGRVRAERRGAALPDGRTPLGFPCTECSKYFENKNQRWKHVQRFHREGFRCHACGKRFAFKHSLARHEQLHSAPLPREQCGECGKMVRVDLVKVHARIHAPRERLSCAACDKTFASRASYTHHLKYTMSHASTDILKYKCSVCEKGYRSRGELRDHENYQHEGRTRHQCPVCGKALATRRCITRHVRRAHHGLKESARDKMCQQCGKAFRDKKGLREHEAIHTGERPLSCEVCGCTFRQSASLYTHRKRVHKIHAPRKQVQVLEETR